MLENLSADKIVSNIIEKKISAIKLEDGTLLEAENIISSLHPLETIKIIGEKNFKRNFTFKLIIVGVIFAIFSE